MAGFELTGPDGGTYQVDAPDEASALAAFHAMHAPAPEPVNATNVARSAVHGVPILGGLADKAEAGLETAGSYLAEPVMRAVGAERPGNMLSDATPDFDMSHPIDSAMANIGARFSKANALQQQKTAGFESAHPYVDTAAKIGGGVASTIPLVAAAPAAFGVTGTLPQMVTRGAASSAALSAADAVTRGQDPVTAAEEGGVIGAVAGPAGKLIGKGAQLFQSKAPWTAANTMEVAGVKVPVPNQDPVAAGQIELGRRDALGAQTKQLVDAGDADAAAKLEQARTNIGASMSPDGTPAPAPQDAAEGVAAELRAAEQQRFQTEQAAAQRAAADTDAMRTQVAGGQPLVASPEGAAEQVSAQLRNIEAQRAQTVEQTRQGAIAGTEALRSSLGQVDPLAPPAIHANSPGAAAEAIGQGVTGRAAAARTAYQGKYKEAEALDSEFAPGAFRNTSDTIRARLDAGDSPVRVDRETTPNASSMLDDIDNNVSLGNFENLAEPRPGAPGAAPPPSDAEQAAARLAAMGVPADRAASMTARLPGAPPVAEGGSSGNALAPHEVAVPGGGSVQVAPQVVEAASLRTSADPGYDSALQPRDRSRAASGVQVRDMAANLNPSRLGASAEADRGAPIVGPDGMVESGNGRVQAIRQAYAENGPAAQRYRAWLQAQGADVSGLREPVLVRTRTTPMDPEARRAFTVAANQSSTLSMSAAERALADAKALPPETLSLIKNPADLGAVENRDFVRAFMQRLPQTEQGALMTARGDLSSEGLTRVRNAVLAKAYGDTPILSRIAESTNDDVRSISSALTSAAPEWASLRAEIAAGRVPAELDATPDLIDAVARTARIRAKGIGLADSRAQIDALTQQSPESEAIQKLFYAADGEKAAPASQVGNALRNYAQEAAKVDASPGLGLGLEPVTKQALLEQTAAKAGAPKDLAASVKAAAAETAKASAPEAAAKKVDLKSVDAARKRLVSFYQAAKDAVAKNGMADVRATRRIMNEFDQYVIDTVGSPAYKGDPAAHQILLDARKGVAEYHAQFSNQRRGDEVGPQIEKILGRFPGQKATPDQIETMSYGSRAEPGGAQSVKVGQRLRQILGPTSPEWGAHKQGMFSYLVDAGPGREPYTFAEQADRIERFLDGSKGRPYAQTLLTPEDRAGLAQHARNLRAAEPVPLNQLGDVDKMVARISGRDGGVPPSPSETIDLLLGRAGSDKGESIALVGHLKETLGEKSPQFSGLKQALLDRTLNGNGSKVLSNSDKADRLDAMLRGELSKTMYTPNDRRGLEALSTSLRAGEPVALSSLNSVEKVLARISGRDGGAPATTTEVVDWLWGRAGTGDKGMSNLVAQTLMRKLSPEGRTLLQQGMWAKLTGSVDGQPALSPTVLKKRLHEFLNGNGRGMARALYDDPTLAEMAKYADAVTAHAPVAGTTNPSGTAPMIAKMAGKAAHMALPLMGFMHGGVGGAVVGVAADRAVTAAKNAMAARQIGKMYYGPQPVTPVSPGFAKAGMLLTRGAQQGQVGNDR